MKLHPVKPKQMPDIMPMNEKRMPHVSFDFSTIPDIKNWQTGEKYKVTLELKMTGKHEDKFMNHGEFEILSAGGEHLSKVRRHTT
jgi:hypothetical protein